MRRVFWACLVWTVFAAAHSARADALRVDRSEERMRVDGALLEWKGAHFAELGDSDDAHVRYALASNDDGLFIGAEVADDVLVRKDKAGPGQDALVLSLAVPSADGRFRVLQLYLYPGRAGRQKALAALRRGAGAEARLEPLSAAQLPVVEGPLARAQGYVLEAFVPFALISGADGWDQGRATLRYEDVDEAHKSRPKRVLGTSADARPEAWPRIALGVGQNDLLGAFMSEKNLSGVEPRFDRRADVAGDRTPERVVIVGSYLLVYGPHFKRGESYAYFALPYGVGGGLSSAELIDLTGDARAELLLRVRQKNSLGLRELALVVGIQEDGIRPLFSVETKKEAKGGFVESKLHVDKKHKPVRLVVARGRAEGLSAATYDESPARDAAPILLPWGGVERRAYAFDGQTFALVEEVKDKQALAEPAQTASTAPSVASDSAPARPTGDALAALLFDREKSGKRPPQLRMERRANITGGASPERVLAYQTQVVVTGGDLGAGLAYVSYGLPVASEADLLSIDTADVTGDARDELLVRYARSSDPNVRHELLMVLTLDAAVERRALRPLVVCEVARRLGDSAIVNQVEVKAGTLRIAPGKARGFNAQNYPFDQQASKGIERVLLPWSDTPRSYHYTGGRLVAR